MAVNSIDFGTPGYTPGYESNDTGSYERNYNAQLNQYTPEELLARYKSGKEYGMNIDRSNSLAYRSFVEQIGREPTSSEFAQILPAFQQNSLYGNAILGSIRDRLAQNPNDPINKGKSGQYTDQINQTFQSMLGRAATADEASHFGNLLATGNVDTYQLQDFLRGTPEFQTQADTKFRSGLGKELEDQDVSFFNRASQGVRSQFLNQGTGNSSALDSALTDLMGQISQQRSKYLSDLSAKQYGGNKELALSNYGNTQNEFLNNQNYNRGLSQRNSDAFSGRSNELSDYQTQMSDYMRMNKGSGSNRGMGAFGGALAGAGAGAPLGPWGAAGGAAAGGLYGYLNS